MLKVYVNIYIYIHNFYVFTFDCAECLLLHGLFSSCSAQASLCGASLVEHRLEDAQAPVLVDHGLSGCSLLAPERRISSCGTRASLLRSRSDLPGSGIEPL